MSTKNKPLAFLILLLTLVLSLPANGKTSAQSVAPPQPEFKLYFPALSYTLPPEWIGPEGGLISAIVFNLHDPAILYAGSWGGGVYKSTDGGASWKRSSTGLGNLTVVSLAIDPADPSKLYAGTYHGKVWKSDDAGANWFLASNGIQADAIVYSLVIDPQNAQRIYAATRGDSQNDRPWAGVVYRSEDGGANWSVALANLGGSDYQDWVYSLEINPTRPNIIFGATHEHGPIRSKDYGAHWEILTNGITNKSTRAIVVDPRSDYVDTVYTGVWTRTGVFKSTDGGGTWELKDVGIAGANIYGMDINPFAPKTIFAATYNMGVMRSTNGATSWSSTGLKSIGIATVQVSPHNGQVVYSGTAGDGLYVSTDGGSNWHHSQNHLTASNVSDLLVPTGSPEVYYAGINGSGVLASDDQGKTWTAFNPNLKDGFINALVRRPGQEILFALSENDGLYRCDLNNLAACWQHIDFRSAIASSSQPLALPYDSHESYLQAFDSQNPEIANSPAAVTATGAPLTLQFSGSDSTVAYLGTRDTGVYRSLDGGQTWAHTSLPGQNVWSLAIDPANPMIVTAASDLAGGINQSSDGGINWTGIGIPGVVAYVLEADPGGQNALWAGTSNGIYHFENGVWGLSGLAGQSVTAVAIYPGKNNLIFAGTTSGVWISKDGSGSWFEGPIELQGIPVQSIAFDPNQPDLVFYCTPAHGVLRAHLGTVLQP